MSRKTEYLNAWPCISSDSRIYMMAFASPGTFAYLLTIKYSDPYREEGEPAKPRAKRAKSSILRRMLGRLRTGVRTIEQES